MVAAVRSLCRRSTHGIAQLGRREHEHLGAEAGELVGEDRRVDVVQAQAARGAVGATETSSVPRRLARRVAASVPASTSTSATLRSQISSSSASASAA